MAGITLSEFADRVNEIMPVISREFLRHQSAEFYKTKVTVPQFVVMSILYRQGELKMTDLARLMNVTTAAVTGIIDRLVRDRYIKRHHDSEDRRIIKVSLTNKGNSTVKNMSEKQKEITMKVFGMISQEEREQYINILTHIQHHLQE
jgi:DNA-binding MarR family transcriptional regulator